VHPTLPFALARTSSSPFHPFSLSASNLLCLLHNFITFIASPSFTIIAINNSNDNNNIINNNTPMTMTMTTTMTTAAAATGGGFLRGEPLTAPAAAVCGGRRTARQRLSWWPQPLQQQPHGRRRLCAPRIDGLARWREPAARRVRGGGGGANACSQSQSASVLFFSG